MMGVGIYQNHTTLKVGDKVRTNYFHQERHVVRTLTSLVPSQLAEGGLASADGGDGGNEIRDIAAAWFVKVEQERGA